MPIIVKAWKMNFYKNDSLDGGAMKCAIDDLKPNHIVIHSQTVKNGRMWAPVMPSMLLTLLEKNRGLYEVITSYPHKVYFDIDRHAEPDPEFLGKIKLTIDSIFPNAEYAVSGSETPTKSSYHIVLSNYLIRNDAERDSMKYLTKKWQETEPAFDWKVYTKNRNMKAINQSKDDGRVQQIIENPDFRAHLITCFIQDSVRPFPVLPEETELEIRIARAKSVFDLTTLPKMIIAIPDNFDLGRATPAQILPLFPLNSSFAHDYTHRVARFCYHNGISFDTFLSWLQNKHPNIQSVQAKWQQHWNNMPKFPPVSMYQVRAILKYFYPTITKPPYMLRFQNAFILPQNHIVHIDRIDQEHFNVPYKAKVFNIGMGSGKTAQTNIYLKTIVDSGGDFVWITPNIALANNTLNRISETGVKCADYRGFKTYQKKHGILKEQPNIMICANSLHYLGNRTYHTVVIDEPETFFDRWFGDFMDKPEGTKRRNWEVLLSIFKSAKSIIFLDAFTSKKSIDFLTHFVGEDYVIYEKPNIEIIRKVEYIAKQTNMLDLLTTDIANSKKAFVFYPYKHPAKDRHPGMMELWQSLEEQTGKTGVFYNADQDDDIKQGLADVNSAWANKDFVITNNMITCGVNYDREDFDICYIFVGCFSQARDILQVSARSRFFSSRLIRICFMERMKQPDAWLNDVDRMNCPVYSKLFQNIIIEKEAPTRESINLLCAKAGYKQSSPSKTMQRELELKHFNLLTEADCIAAYDNIPRISFTESEHIQNCMFSHCATMEQKFALQKFFFLNGFKEGAEKHIIDGQPAVALAWDSMLCPFLTEIKNVLWDKEKSIFARLAVANGYSGLFPPNELLNRANRKKIVIPPDIKAEIFRVFKFKYISEHSAPILILEKVFNTAFGKNVINCKLDSEKHANYTCDEQWNEWVEFVMLFCESEKPIPLGEGQFVLALF